MISRFQTEVAGFFFGLPESSGYAVGGGAAAVVHRIVDRSTDDLDMFSENRGPAVSPKEAGRAFTAAARQRGWTVEIIRDFEMAFRAKVGDGTEEIIVDIGQQARSQPPVLTEIGLTVDTRDVAVGKMMALFDRAEVRDFVDVFEFAQRFDRQDLLDETEQRYLGFNRGVLAERFLRIIEFYEPTDLPPTYRERFDEIREFFVSWRRELVGPDAA